MANTFAPFGLRLVDSEGKDFKGRRYVKKSGTIIYPGDVLKQQATGDVTVAAAGDTPIGVALEYKASTDVSGILVCDDPAAVFEIQADDGVTAADVFQNANITATTGDTGLLRSKQDLDVASFGTGSTKTLKIIGLSSIGENAYGSFARMLVKLNVHTHKSVGTDGI